VIKVRTGDLDLLIILIVIGFLFLFPKLAPQYLIVLSTSLFVYCVIAKSWAVFSGPTGYVSLAPAVFFGIGVYISALFSFKLSLPILVSLAGIISFILALPMGLLTLRLKGIYFTIFTFSLIEFFRHFILWSESTFFKTRGRIVAIVDYRMVYYTMLVIFALLLIFSFLLRKSRYQLALKAIGENEDAAAHCGVDLTLTKVIIFALSSIFIGASGAVMAMRWTYIDPYIAFNPNYSFIPVLMALIGGTQNFYGPVLGAVILGLLEEKLITAIPHYSLAALGVILIFTVMYLPNGLMPFLSNILNKFMQKLSGKIQNDLRLNKKLKV